MFKLWLACSVSMFHKCSVISVRFKIFVMYLSLTRTFHSCNITSIPEDFCTTMGDLAKL